MEEASLTAASRHNLENAAFSTKFRDLSTFQPIRRNN
jgi:hypothetical protein